MKSNQIPKFHFPFGAEIRPESSQKLEIQIEEIYKIFPASGGGSLTHIEQFCDFVNIPKNWRKLICYAAARGRDYFVLIRFLMLF